MGVIGHWRRSVLGAGGVALLLPLGLTLGVLLTTALGGHATLRALRQVLSGPAAPAAQGGLAAPGLESAARVPQLPVSARRPAAARHHTSVARAPARSPSHHAAPAPAPRGPQRPSGRLPTPRPARAGASAGSGGGPPPPAAPPKSAAHDTGQQVADTAKGLPSPAGPEAGDAAQTVVDLIP
ncbi:MAG: hypothetical protein QOF12_2137 [Solirubrobacteraceae bacterium]|nr:hypothetical protein [Solirubrobacteraceae bacterium]